MQWREVVCCDGELNMTYLALSLSHYVNGVAKKHGEVSQLMFARYKIDAITNGVDVLTWAAPSFQKLFDRRIPGWREDNLMLRYALGISLAEIWDAHLQAKRALLARVNSETQARWTKMSSRSVSRAELHLTNAPTYCSTIWSV